MEVPAPRLGTFLRSRLIGWPVGLTGSPVAAVTARRSPPSRLGGPLAVDLSSECRPRPIPDALPPFRAMLAASGLLAVDPSSGHPSLPLFYAFIALSGLIARRSAYSLGGPPTHSVVRPLTARFPRERPPVTAHPSSRPLTPTLADLGGFTTASSLPLGCWPVRGQFLARESAFRSRPGRSWRIFYRIEPSSRLLARSRSVPRASVRLPAPPWLILVDLPPFPVVNLPRSLLSGPPARGIDRK